MPAAHARGASAQRVTTASGVGVSYGSSAIPRQDLLEGVQASQRRGHMHVGASLTQGRLIWSRSDPAAEQWHQRRGQMYVGAFLRQDPPEGGLEGLSEREQASGLMSAQKLYEVGTLAKVENLVRHDKIEGAQLLLYGHTRIRRLEMVRRPGPSIVLPLVCCRALHPGAA